MRIGKGALLVTLASLPLTNSEERCVPYAVRPTKKEDGTELGLFCDTKTAYNNPNFVISDDQRSLLYCANDEDIHYVNVDADGELKYKCGITSLSLKAVKNQHQFNCLIDEFEKSIAIYEDTIYLFKKEDVVEQKYTLWTKCISHLKTTCKNLMTLVKNAHRGKSYVITEDDL